MSRETPSLPHNHAYPNIGYGITIFSVHLDTYNSTGAYHALKIHNDITRTWTWTWHVCMHATSSVKSNT